MGCIAWYGSMEKGHGKSIKSAFMGASDTETQRVDWFEFPPFGHKSSSVFRASCYVRLDVVSFDLWFQKSLLSYCRLYFFNIVLDNRLNLPFA
jgi:hypothetical protein